MPFQNGYITYGLCNRPVQLRSTFSEKKKIILWTLQYLNGFEDNDAIYGAGDGMAELGKIIQRKMSGGKNLAHESQNTGAF